MAAAYYNPPPLGPYDYKEVLSALRKDIKLNNEEDAIYWACVLLHYLDKDNGGPGGGPATIAKQLWIMAAEDIDDPVIVNRAYACYQMCKVVSETDHLIYLIAHMCRARKWWETAEGRETDLNWSKAVGDIRSNPRPIPEYALDRHTKRGWDNFKRTGAMDDRFSGTDQGRQKTVYMFVRDGLIDKASNVWKYRNGKPDDGFKAFWGRIRQIQAMIVSDLEPNDPLGKEGVPTSRSTPGADRLFDS